MVCKRLFNPFTDASVSHTNSKQFVSKKVLTVLKGSMKEAAAVEEKGWGGGGVVWEGVHICCLP